MIQIQNTGWKAKLALEFKATTTRTIISKRAHKGPLAIQRPFYPEGEVCHVYLLHPPGGVVGGDQLQIDVQLQDQAQVLITTPGATKFYRNTGQLAQQKQSLKIAEGCALEWFPQENIFFDKTHSTLITSVQLEKSARFMGWEIQCYGRPAAKEKFSKGIITTTLAIYRDGKPILHDRLQINNQAELNSMACINNYPCFGTFVSTDATSDLLDKARAAVEILNISSKKIEIGITLLDDLLIARCLGQHAEQVTTVLKAVWSALREDIMQRPVCLPRIWAT
ncbi:MAG: urease accessory protein UreD [Aquificaceae bacterium]|nr:MAG: urease accessory protein UreD [Aquificaceae bacterium]